MPPSFRNWRTSRRYRNKRADYMQRHPYCEECLKDSGRKSFSVQLDHIIPLFKGGDLWDESNWQALCEPCHDKKSQEEKRQIIGSDIHGNPVGETFVKL